MYLSSLHLTSSKTMAKAPTSTRLSFLSSKRTWILSFSTGTKRMLLFFPSLPRLFLPDLTPCSGFDLWEEVRGSSFFTTAVQHRALVEGSTFFDALGSSNNVYSATAENVLCFLQSYWSPRGYIVSNINHNSGRGGLDGNSYVVFSCCYPRCHQLIHIAFKYPRLNPHIRFRCHNL